MAADSGYSSFWDMQYGISKQIAPLVHYTLDKGS